MIIFGEDLPAVKNFKVFALFPKKLRGQIFNSKHKMSFKPIEKKLI